MVDQVSGKGGMSPLSPEDKRAYEAEYKHGLDLFERALDDYGKKLHDPNHSKNIFQQHEFKQVMEKAMQVLKETSNELQRKELLEQTKKLEQDLIAFEDQDSTANIAQLQKDLHSAKRSV